MNEYRFKSALFLVILIYLAAASSSAYTLLPNVDEGWFTVPAYNLAENGFFGTTTVEESATFRQVRLDGIRQYTYWIMPAYPLVQALWGKIAGFGMMQTRSVSVIFGVIALLSWAFLIKKLSSSNGVALLAVAILAIDQHFIYSAGHGRMDMMTVALGASGLAAFVGLRERNLDRAVLFSCTLTAAAFFTHPLGLLWFVSLTILAALLDFRKIRIKHFILAAAPYFVFGLLWSIYIFQRPDLFFLQFGGNASDRWGFFSAPLAELWREIRVRYLFNFGIGDGLSRAGRIKIFILAGYLMSLIGILSVKNLREQMLSRFLLLIALQQFVMLLLLDGLKQHYYMIYVAPTLTAILAVFVTWLWRQNKPLKVVSAAMLLTIAGIHSSVHFLRFKRDDYHTRYLAAGNALNQNAQPNDLIMATSEFWFVLNHKENLVDDFRLGYLTGKKPVFVVMDSLHYKDWIPNLTKNENATYQFIENLLQNDYLIIYEDDTYQVYKHR